MQYPISPGNGKISLLIIDDDEGIRGLISDIGSKAGWETAQADSGESGIEMVRHAPELFDIVLLDLRMPGMSGVEVLPELIKYGNDLAVIVMTGYAEVDTAVELMKRGAADLLQKPVKPGMLIARVARAYENTRMKKVWSEYLEDIDLRVRQRFTELDEARRLTIFGLARLAEYRDKETGYHLERISEYVVALASALAGRGLYRDILRDRYLHMMYESAPLHDIGKVGIPDSILHKPGKLSAEEFEVMKQHSMIGARTLEDVQERVDDKMFLTIGIEFARSHHEKYDGSGYPDGLSGHDIPLTARILTIADFYDALATNRVYRPYSYEHDEIVEMILARRGKKFDPDLVDCFGDCHNEFRLVRNKFSD
jgi:putative two-component system response regulator